MGNTDSNVTNAVRQQAAGEGNRFALYSFIDANGGGKLVELMKKANRTRNYKELDDCIDNEMKPFFYNEGAGKMVHVKELVLKRQKKTPRPTSVEQVSQNSLLRPQGTGYY